MAHQHALDVHLTGLLGKGGVHGVVVHDDKDDVRIGSLDLGQLSAELSVAGLALLLGDELTAVGNIGFFDELTDCFGVGVAVDGEQSALHQAKILGGVGADDGADVGIQEAHTEGVGMQIALLIDGDELIGSGGADDGNLQLIRNGGHRNVAGREVGADFSDDAVVGDELAQRVHGVGGVALAVHRDELEHLAVQHAAGGVDLFDGFQSAELTGVAPEGGGLGEVTDVADLDGVIRGTGCGHCEGDDQDDHQNQRQCFFHFVDFLLIIWFHAQHYMPLGIV